MTTLRIVSWNMARSVGNWHVVRALLEDQPAVALLQEAVEPEPWSSPPDLAVLPGGDETEPWKTLAGGYRPFVTAAAAIDGSMEIRRHPQVPIAEAYGNLTSSHPGAFTAVDVTTPDGDSITVVSLYGIWEEHAGVKYSEATLHRVISDLTPLLQDPPPGGLLLAGDLNVYLDYGDYWDARYMTVFNRLAAYGMQVVSRGEGPLEGCPCGPRDDCRHFRTYAHNRNVNNRLLQLDFVFASENLAPHVLSCTPLADFEYRDSDHVPIVTTIERPAT